MTPLFTAGLLIIENRRLLLAFSNNKQCFYLPGGKLNPGETAPHALCMEISEELLLYITVQDLIYYTHISAPAFGEAEGIMMEQDCYLLSRPVTARPSAEISAIQYFTLSAYLHQPKQAPGAVMILQQLATAGLIDE